ncbi:MAG: protein kinase [Gemmataceae bacterium]
MTERDIFLAVIDLPDASARAAHLDAICRGDVALRSRVEKLLRSHESAGSFLGMPAVATSEPDHTDTRTFPATAAEDDNDLGFLAPPGRPDSLGRIGHYEVLEVLGRGGFGIVFRAFDDVLQRVVAVKVLAPQVAATSPARKRFLREARSSAQVRHENVVQTYAVEEQPLPYLVMEYIPGDTLQQRLNRTGPLDVAEILRIGRQVAEGLAAAHAEGLIHRDIKPANVLIEGGPAQRVKLTDFGLARAADDASISQSGVLAGTPMYMAPEQAKGEALDHRADLFSLGSVLYVMCSGRPPFRASGAMAVLKRVCEDNPRPIQEIIPEVPVWLCRIVEKLHAKDPAERFQSARAVADVLADCETQWKAHGTLKDFSHIPGGKPVRKPRQARPGLALAAVGLSFLIFAIWANPFARRFVELKHVIEIEPADGLVSLTVYQDGHAVTDWFAATARPRIELLPGDYRIEPVFAPGRTADRWEVTTFGFGPARSTTQDGPAVNIHIVRGERVTVRAVTREVPPAVPTTAAEVLPFLAGTWKAMMPPADAKLSPDAPRDASFTTFDFVAGGKFLRQSGMRHAIFTYDAEKGLLRQWAAASAAPSGSTWGPATGLFNPTNGTVTWTARSGEGNEVIHQSEAIDANAMNIRVFQRDAKDNVSQNLPVRLTRVNGPATLPDWPTDPKRPDEMKVLDRFVGDWHTELTLKTIATPDRTQAQVQRTRAASILGGRFVEMIDADETTGVTDYSLVWYELAAKRYRTWFFSGAGHVSDLIGTWDEAAKTMTWHSPDKRLEGRYVFESDDRRTFQHLIKATDGRVLSEANAVSRRVAPPTPANAVLDALRAQVTAKERLAKTAQARHDAGATSRMEPLATEVELAEAHVRLAEAERDAAAIVARLHELVTLHEEERVLTAKQVEAGVARQEVLDQVDAHLVDAKARLAKVRPAGGATPFVLCGSGTAAERGFATLAEAVAAAPAGGTVEVRGDGPFVVPAVEVARPLAVRAGVGYRPVIVRDPADATKASVLTTTAALVLEGLEFQDLVGDVQTQRGKQLVVSKDAPLLTANCRFTSTVATNGALRSPRVELRNCEVVNAWTMASAVSWVSPPSRGVLRLRNCVSPNWAIFVLPTDAGLKDIEIELTGNSFAQYLLMSCYSAGELWTEEAGPKPFRVRATDNVLRTQNVFRVEMIPSKTDLKTWPLARVERFAASLFDYRGDRNVYAPTSGYELWYGTDAGQPERQAKTRAEWKGVWGAGDANAVEGDVRFQGGGLGQRAQAAPQRITAADFRLAPGSAGKGAGPGGKDLGADIDLVGPGAGYERWKRTPDYQEWRKQADALLAGR